MQTKVFVGYATRLVDGHEKLMPQFSAPSNYKNQDVIDEYIAKKTDAFLKSAATRPYMARLSDVCLIDATSRKVARFTESTKGPSVAAAVRQHLVKTYPNAFKGRFVEGADQVVFFGFHPRTFVKLLGIECSLPGSNCPPCPPGLWYDSDGYRDIAEAAAPAEFSLELDTILDLRAPLDPESKGKWETLVKRWRAGADAEASALLAIELASQLGFLTDVCKTTP